jgi:tetratricopeptide (TPR) repeat protein
LEHLGRYEEAIQALEKGLLLGGAPFWRAFLASACIKAGQRDRAEIILDELLEHAKQQGGAGVAIALVAEALGHGDLALDSLERAYSNRDDMPLYAIQITNFLPFTSLRGHPRFEAIVDGLGFSPHDIEGERKRLLERERGQG